jgi:hypothetical protein
VRYAASCESCAIVQISDVKYHVCCIRRRIDDDDDDDDADDVGNVDDVDNKRKSRITNFSKWLSLR